MIIVNTTQEFKIGNCLDLIKEIADKSIKLIVTDPPYCVGTTSNGSKGSWLDNNLIMPFFDVLMAEFKRVLKDDGELYLCSDWRTYPFLYIPVAKKFVIKNCIVWDYEWIKAGTHYRFSHEFIIYAINDKNKRGFSASKRDVWRIPPINFTSDDKHHQTEKPIKLFEEMILNSSKEEDSILDPFLGSGTSLIACRKHNRNGIGFEIDPDMEDVIKKRLMVGTPQLETWNFPTITEALNPHKMVEVAP